MQKKSNSKCDAHQYSYKTSVSRKSKVKNKYGEKLFRKSDGENSEVGIFFAKKPGGEHVIRIVC